jgi:hypothetical protein
LEVTKRGEPCAKKKAGMRSGVDGSSSRALSQASLVFGTVLDIDLNLTRTCKGLRYKGNVLRIIVEEMNDLNTMMWG